MLLFITKLSVFVHQTNFIKKFFNFSSLFVIMSRESLTWLPEKQSEIWYSKVGKTGLPYSFTPYIVVLFPWWNEIQIAIQSLIVWFKNFSLNHDECDRALLPTLEHASLVHSHIHRPENELPHDTTEQTRNAIIYITVSSFER